VTAILSKWIFEERHPLDEFLDFSGRKIFWKDGEERRSYNKERKVAAYAASMHCGAFWKTIGPKTIAGRHYILKQVAPLMVR
jgi:hypothetical protein